MQRSLPAPPNVFVLSLSPLFLDLSLFIKKSPSNQSRGPFVCQISMATLYLELAQTASHAPSSMMFLTWKSPKQVHFSVSVCTRGLILKKGWTFPLALFLEARTLFFLKGRWRFCCREWSRCGRRCGRGERWWMRGLVERIGKGDGDGDGGRVRGIRRCFWPPEASVDIYCSKGLRKGERLIIIRINASCRPPSDAFASAR